MTKRRLKMIIFETIMYRFLKPCVIVSIILLVLLTLIVGGNSIFAKQVCFKDIAIYFSAFFGSMGILFSSLTYFFNRESNEKSQIEKYYTNLNSDINESLYEDKKGVEAYLNFKLGEGKKNVFLDNLNLVLISYEMYLKLIDENKIISKFYKTFGKTKLHLLFYSKVLWSIHETMIDNGQEFINGKHDDSKLTIPKFSKLSISCIQYLTDNKIIQDSPFKNDIVNKLSKLNQSNS